MLEGVVDRPAPRWDRVRVLLMLMGVAVSIEVDADSLEVC
jgi:hypothetical protein